MDIVEIAAETCQIHTIPVQYDLMTYIQGSHAPLKTLKMGKFCRKILKIEFLWLSATLMCLHALKPIILAVTLVLCM